MSYCGFNLFLRRPQCLPSGLAKPPSESPMSNEKLIVVVGATGSQGSSVVNTFLSDSTWRIRALTRDPNSAKAKALVARSSRIGVTSADANSVESLKQAFEGAHAVFGMTDFWSLYGDMSNREIAKKEMPLRSFPEWCAEKEATQGKNIFEAAADIPTLERLIFSSLSNVSKQSGGKYKNVLHFDSKAIAMEWAEGTLPDVWAKTSCVMLGMYVENFLTQPFLKPYKEGDTFMFHAMKESKSDWPFVAASQDTGPIVLALVEKASPDKHVIAYRELMPLKDFIDLWGSTLGVKAGLKYGELSGVPEELEPELRETFEYCAEFGYWGGDRTVLHPKDVGVEIRKENGSVEDWIKAQDWSSVLSGTRPESVAPVPKTN